MYKLSEILTLIGGGTPKTTNPSYWGGSIPWLSVVDFNNDNRYVHTTEKTITEDGVQNSSTKILPQGALILSARGTVGALAQLAKPMAFNQSCYGITAKEQTTNDFLYYLLKNVVKDLQAKGHGSVFNTITRDTFDTITVNLPPLDEQKRITQILGALDDKIELLQKQNKTLEDMAKAIFKSWFVDFDVVHAKAALTSSSNALSPLRGKCPEGAKGGQNQEHSSCALVPTHQLYTKHVKNLVRGMRQNLTPQEVKLWQHVRKEQLGVKFRRQFPIDSKYIADFACVEKKLIIELDGSQHAEKQQDQERTLYLEDNGFTVLRFWNNEIDHNLTGCLEEIRKFLNQPPLPACGILSPQGGQIKTKADIMREYHLTDELYDFFPSSFEPSALGPIPLGWQVKTLGDFFPVKTGKKDANVASKIGKYPFFSCAQNILRTDEYSFDNTALLLAGNGDFNLKWYRGKFEAYQRTYVLIPNHEKDLPFLYYAMQFFLDKITLGSRGSVIKFITKGMIENYKLVIPEEHLWKYMSELLGQWTNKIESNLKQIQTLTELRDALLPRLISGKIRV